MKERDKFGSRLGFILVSAGCAVGLGNVWKFPYICGQNGGAAFILIYLVFLPIMASFQMVFYYRKLPSDDVLHDGRRLDAVLYLPQCQRDTGIYVCG